MCSKPNYNDPKPPESQPPPEIILDEATAKKRNKRRTAAASRRGRSALRVDLAIGASPSSGLAIPTP